MTLKLGPHVQANNSNHAYDDRLFQIAWPFATWLGTGSDYQGVPFGWLDRMRLAQLQCKISGRYMPLEGYYKARKPSASAAETGRMYAYQLMDAGVPQY